MASKGPRSKLDHDTRAKRQKAIEAPLCRPKTHWDHVLEEMAWLSRDFERERKWKLGQAKRVALKASKGNVDQATRGEKRVKEEEQKLRKVALNISKDVKKFWTKIEKLVLYKHQLELDEKKKKALDKQLEFLLGQTERYSSMLAENLVISSPAPCKPSTSDIGREKSIIQWKGDDDVTQIYESDIRSQSNIDAIDEDYSLQSEDESDDDERTIEVDEALITKDEREEELAALQNEIDLPLDEVLKQYAAQEVGRDKISDNVDNASGATDLRDNNGKENTTGYIAETDSGKAHAKPVRRCVESNGVLFVSENQMSEVKTYKKRNSVKKLLESEKKQMMLNEFNDEHEDDDFVLSSGDESDYGMDDETTLSAEEELANADPNSTLDEIDLLRKESEISVEELLARYKKDINMNENGGVDSESSYASPSGSSELGTFELKQPNDKTNGFHPDICPHLEEGETGFLGASKDVESEEDVIADAAAAARSAQPTGNTFLTTNVRTKFPFLLKYPLREYQHIGLDWLVTMYDKRLNGILADEMGLGKTIMTIALLAHLACEKGIWGPHLIVVPTSVMLNWETEFLKWCPAFKILTYFGSAKERKIKRQGWLKPNSFHICITTYRLVIQDSKVFKRKKWKYLILDEAHLIKNWKSQRWQTLLNFNSKRRILLTGTPLQNDLMELWSLMHFLMPHVFQSHEEFKEWFSNPISGMADGQERVNREVVDRLHNVLRPFILRRLKRDVEKQLPMKREHVIYCRLSRRQRNLYEDFIASSETQATLASSNFFGMISVIMQLRKVCNHPDLFEGRPIVSSYDMSGLDVQLSSSVCSMLSAGPFSTVDLSGLGFVFTHLDFSMTSWESEIIQAIGTPSSLINHHVNLLDLEENQLGGMNKKRMDTTNIFEDIQKSILTDRLREAKERAAAIAWWNSLRCKKKPMYTSGLRELVSVRHPVFDIHLQKNGPMWNQFSRKLADIVLSPVDRFGKIVDYIESFMFAIPAVRTPAPVCWCSKGGSPVIFDQSYKERCSQVLLPLLTPFRSAIVRRQVYFPDRRLVQFDCGKLQQLALLLRRLKSEGHRALIFTQMTKMLDILEAFINLYGYTYMRLDGSTPPEERQTLMQRFNTNPKIFLFILSTRSGGVGINLVGADTVIFYDSDWNPAMDQQAQDRCHRIGQTREVNIYRLISESTIEENILKKANQKRVLDDLVIQSGSYNTEFFKKLDPMELFSGHRKIKDTEMDKSSKTDVDITLSNLDLDAALKNAEDEADYMAMKKVEEEEAVDNQEFTEEAVVKLEDDELVNEDEMKPDDSAAHSPYIPKSDGDNVMSGSHRGDAGLLPIDTKEDDIDMLADVKQMAATAAAAGQEIFSFEKHLRPIDQYAVRFLELWDPIIDKAAVESNVLVEEQEWELERIEKLKNDMEAEIDDEEEPLMYEKWDTDFATEVYRQQVETLAQHQLIEDLEREAQEKAALEAASLRNDIYVPLKKKKKAKKAKFKSLKKGALGSKAVPMKEESSLEDQLSIDDDYDDLTSSDELSPPCSTQEKKRKPASDDEPRSGRKAKKSKASELDDILLYPKSFSKHRNEQKDLRIYDADVVELEPMQISRSKNRGKLSISIVPLKRVFTIKPEKLKKKVNIWSTDCFSHPDPWSADEDAVLCAVVYEYGPNWNLASEILYGMTAGGCYRGRFRHPIHCSERVRELIQRYVLSLNDATNKDKATNVSAGKAILRVTEDNMRQLLGITSEVSDHERLLENHFIAVISATWRNPNRWNSTRPGFSSSLQLFGSMINNKQSSMPKSSKEMEFTSLRQCGKLIEAALNADCNCELNNRIEEVPEAEEQLDVTLEVEGEKDEASPIPPLINVSISGPILKMYAGDDSHVRPLRVERQYSIVSGTNNENCPSVESHIGACSQLKSKILHLDSPKLSKPKHRKASKDLHTPAAATIHEVFTHLPKTPTDLSELSSFLPEAGSIEFELNWHLHMDDSSLNSLETFPVDNQSDLEDWSVLPEFTDIFSSILN